MITRKNIGRVGLVQGTAQSVGELLRDIEELLAHV